MLNSVILASIALQEQQPSYFVELLGFSIEYDLPPRIGVSRIPKQKLANHSYRRVALVTTSVGRPEENHATDDINVRGPFHQRRVLVGGRRDYLAGIYRICIDIPGVDLDRTAITEQMLAIELAGDVLQRMGIGGLRTVAQCGIPPAANVVIVEYGVERSY